MLYQKKSSAVQKTPISLTANDRQAAFLSSTKIVQIKRKLRGGESRSRCDSASSSFVYDDPFCFQCDVAIQCNLIGDVSPPPATSGTGRMSTTLDPPLSGAASRSNSAKGNERRVDGQRQLFGRRRAITVSEPNDGDMFHDGGGPLFPDNQTDIDSRSLYNRNSSLASGVSSRGRHSTVPDEDIFKILQPSNLGMRNDILPSPQLSPLSWFDRKLDFPACSLFTSPDLDDRREHGESSNEPNKLTVPVSPHRRTSLGSNNSISEELEDESSPPGPMRERRKAICDTEEFPTESETTTNILSNTNRFEKDINSRDSPTTHDPRKRSSADLGTCYPGDLVTQPRPRRMYPLLKRYTVDDFANTKAYQTSISSLISASEQDRKGKSPFSLLKLPRDKKSSRSKEKMTMAEMLQTMKPSEFKDNFLTVYKNVHWTDLVACKDQSKLSGNMSETELQRRDKRREAVWEMFQSECVFLIDHLMVLKHCFMEPLKQVQVEGYLMFAEPSDLFGNLDEIISASHTFCFEFITLLLKDAQAFEFGRTEVLLEGLQKFCELTRDGDVYHEYCLNYSKAMSYLEQLRKNDEFSEFEKWCENDPRCHRLQLADLLISPMQHYTKVPLLLNKIHHYTESKEERRTLISSLEKLETSLKNLEAKIRWLKNYERVQEIQQQVIWRPITELEPRTFIPEFLRSTLQRQPCEKLLSCPSRQLLHEDRVLLHEVSKTIEMYLFLFDDLLLLTRIKKPPRKKPSYCEPLSPYMQTKMQTDGAVFIVHGQPIALDRYTVHDVKPPDHITTSLRSAFVLVQVSRFQQIIAVYTLQATSETAKATWMNKLQDAQDKYVEAASKIKLSQRSGLSQFSFDFKMDYEIESSDQHGRRDNPGRHQVLSKAATSPLSSRLSHDSFEHSGNSSELDDADIKDGQGRAPCIRSISEDSSSSGAARRHSPRAADGLDQSLNCQVNRAFVSSSPPSPTPPVRPERRRKKERQELLNQMHNHSQTVDISNA